MAERRPVSLKPQQEVTLRHVQGCHGVDWPVVKLAPARTAGKGSFYKVPYFIGLVKRFYIVLQASLTQFRVGDELLKPVSPVIWCHGNEF